MASDTRHKSDFGAREAAERQRRVAEYDRYADERDRWRAKNARLLSRHRAAGALRRARGRERARDRLRHRRSARRAQADATASASTSRRGMIERARAASTRARRSSSPTPRRSTRPSSTGSTFDYVVMSDVVGQLYDVWARVPRAAPRRATRARASSSPITTSSGSRSSSSASGSGRRCPSRSRTGSAWATSRTCSSSTTSRSSARAPRSCVPADVPVVAPLANRYLAQLPGLRHLALTQFFVVQARRRRRADPDARLLVHAWSCRARTSAATSTTSSRARREMGRGTELIFVDGNSDDGTVEEIETPPRRAQRPRRAPHPPGRRQGQGRRRAQGLRRRHRRRALDPRRRPHRAARGSAQVLRRHRRGQGRVRQRLAPRLPDGGRGDALPQPRSATSSSALALSCDPRAAPQGHAVRHQGALPPRLRAHRRRRAASSATSIRSATSICSSAPPSRT